MKTELEKVLAERAKLAEELQNACSCGLAEGKRVITDGLRDPNKNHVLGKLCRYDTAGARWQVQLDGASKLYKIKAQNLRPLRDEPFIPESVCERE